MGKLSKLSNLSGFFLRTKILKERTPLIASFKLTYRCNLACIGCPFHRKAAMTDSHMSRMTASRAIIKLKEMGCRIVVFEGGEPLLWRDGSYSFSDLVQEARKHFFCVGATTNGTMPLDVPTDVLWVSIDGLKGTHDALRSSSYSALMENILSSRHPKLFVHYTLNSRNWRDFAAAAEVISSMDRVKGITVQFFYSYNQGEIDLSLDHYDRKKAILNILDLKRLGYPILNSVWGLKAMADNTWRCHDWLLANVEPDGSIHTGCYVKNRGEIRCRDCGFTPVAEASGAYALKPGSLRSGWDLFIA